MEAELKEPITAEQQLSLMRQGYKVTYKLKYGKLEVPCRLMASEELATVMANAKVNVKVPRESDKKLFESIAVMKQTLIAGCTVGKIPYLNLNFLDQLTHPELEVLYEQYLNILDTVSPEFEHLPPEKIAELIRSVKKNEIATKDLSIFQLGEIGRYFLDDLLPLVN